MSRVNPFVGPRSFVRGEPIFGRDQELSELLDLLVAERIVLLHSPSGAGKTSLIQAALIPALEKRRFTPLPVMRVTLSPPQGIVLPPTSNPYIFSLLLCLEEGLPPDQQCSPARLTTLRLAEYLEERSRLTSGKSAYTVLIFDQFEEILTTSPTDQSGQRAFFAQVGEVLQNRQIWALFTMREEFVAALDPFLALLATRLNTRFQLNLLPPEGAMEAMLEPAYRQGIDFAAGAAETLIDNLRRVRVQRSNGTFDEVLGPFVEPVQLQVVCRRIWDALPATASRIDQEHIATAGNVDQALADYYAEQMSLAARCGVTERTIREWIERHLITEQGIRGQVPMGTDRTADMDNRPLQVLLNAHLLRAEERRGGTWLELAHDRLLEPVRRNNAEWVEQHLSMVQRQAALWSQGGEGDGLLLTGRDLQRATLWAKYHPQDVGKQEQTFLVACERQEARRLAEQRQVRRLHRLAWVSVLFALFSLGVVGVATHFFLENMARQEAQTLDIALRDADLNLRADPRNALLVALRSLSLTPKLLESPTTLDNVARAQSILARVGGYAIRATPEKIITAHFSHDSRWLAFGGQGIQREPLFPTTDSSAIRPSTAPWHVRQVRFGPQAWLAVADDSPTIRLWPESGPPIQLAGHDAPVTTIAFSPDGHWLASGSADHRVMLWPLAGEMPSVPPLAVPLGSHNSGVTDLAFHPTQELLATASLDHTVRLWTYKNPEGQAVSPSVQMANGPVRQLFFAGRDWGWLVGRTVAGEIFLWALGSGPQIQTATISFGLTKAEGPVHDIHVTADGRWLAAAMNDGVRVWDLFTPDQPERWRHPFPLSRGGVVSMVDTSSGEQGGVNRVHRVMFSPDGRQLIALLPQEIILWNDWAKQSTPSPRYLPSPAKEITALTFSPDGRRLFAGGTPGNAWLWTLDDPTWLGEEQAISRGHEDILALQFTLDGQQLLTGDNQGVVAWALHEPPAPAPAYSLAGSDQPTQAMVFGQTHWALLRSDGVVELRPFPDRQQEKASSIPATRMPTPRFRMEGSEPFRALALAGDHLALMTDKEVTLFRVNTSGSDQITMVKVLDSKLFAQSLDDDAQTHDFVQWQPVDVSSAATNGIMVRHQNGSQSLWSLDGQFLRGWKAPKTNAGRKEGCRDRHSCSPADLMGKSALSGAATVETISEDGQWLASFPLDNAAQEVTVQGLNQHKEASQKITLRGLLANGNDVQRLAMNRDGTRLAVTLRPATPLPLFPPRVVVWDLSDRKSGRIVRIWNVTEKACADRLALSPDGFWLAVGCQKEGTIHLLTAQASNLLRRACRGLESRLAVCTAQADGEIP